MKLSRRELLATFLGAPFAMAACSEQRSPNFPDGEIVGANWQLGHVLREGRSFEVPSDNWQSLKIAIVGAGIAGLSAAWKLSRNGISDLVVLELEKDLGGTARSGIGKPVNFPWGAHYLPVPFRENTDLVELLEEMNLIEGRADDGELVIHEEFLCREPEERIFYKGRWYPGLYLHVGASDDDIRQLKAFEEKIIEWVNWKDSAGRRAFAVPSATGSDDADVTALDKISFGDWLRQHGFTSERLFWLCDYSCRDDYGLKLDQTSAWAGIFYFCSRVRKGGEGSQSLITFPEGNGRFVRHLSSVVKDRLLPSHAVVSIVPNERGAEIICLNEGELRGFRCDKVIFAAPVFTAPFVIRGFAEDSPFDAAAFHSNSWFVANLHLKDRPKPRFQDDFPLSWDNVLYDSPSLGYVNATHQKGIDYGASIWTYYYPMWHEEDGRTKLFNYEWRELAEVCLADIGRAHPEIYELTERLDVMRWGHAMISPRPSFIWGGEKEKAMRPYRNIHFAHTDLSGMALFEEAFYHGLRAATEFFEA
jgi:hypothetical protein